MAPVEGGNTQWEQFAGGWRRKRFKRRAWLGESESSAGKSFLFVSVLWAAHSHRVFLAHSRHSRPRSVVFEIYGGIAGDDRKEGGDHEERQRREEKAGSRGSEKQETNEFGRERATSHGRTAILQRAFRNAQDPIGSPRQQACQAPQ